MTETDVRAALAQLLSNVLASNDGAPQEVDNELLDICMEVYKDGRGGTPLGTAALRTALRALESHAPAHTRGRVADAFMQLVAKVSHTRASSQESHEPAQHGCDVPAADARCVVRPTVQDNGSLSQVLAVVGEIAGVPTLTQMHARETAIGANGDVAQPPGAAGSGAGRTPDHASVAALPRAGMSLAASSASTAPPYIGPAALSSGQRLVNTTLSPRTGTLDGGKHAASTAALPRAEAPARARAAEASAGDGGTRVREPARPRGEPASQLRARDGMDTTAETIDRTSRTQEMPALTTGGRTSAAGEPAGAHDGHHTRAGVKNTSARVHSDEGSETEALVRVLHTGLRPLSSVPMELDRLDNALRYGDRVLLRSCVAGGGYLAALPSARAGAGQLSVEGCGVGSALEVFELLPADTGSAPSWRGVAVCNGDALLLRNVATRRYLSSGASYPTTAVLPSRASTSSRIALLTDAVGDGSRWAFLSSASLLAMANDRQSLPSRSVIQRCDSLLLLSFGWDTSVSREDGLATARAAALRMEVLQAGSVIHATMTSKDESIGLKRSIVYIDSVFGVSGQDGTLADARRRWSSSPAVHTVIAGAANAPAAAETWRSALQTLQHAAPGSPVGRSLLALGLSPHTACMWMTVPVLPTTSSHCVHAHTVSACVPATHGIAQRLSPLVVLSRGVESSVHGGGAAALLSTLPLHAHESVFVEHTLAALQGVPGVIYGVDATERSAAGDPVIRFHLRPDASRDPGIRELASRFVPLANAAAGCRDFVARGSNHSVCGRVHQAVAAAASMMLREFTALVLQLQSLARRGATPPRDRTATSTIVSDAMAATQAWLPTFALSLQQLWFYVQPSLRTLMELQGILDGLCTTHGGAVLSKLTALVQETGSDTSRALGKLLLEHAAAPYMRMLESWLYMGELDDPFEEFMILDMGAGVSTQPATFDAMTRFALRPAVTPSFLSTHAGAILLAGKNINLLQLCANAAPSSAGMVSPAPPASDAAARRVPPFAAPLRFSIEPGEYSTAISQALAWASRRLMDHFMGSSSSGGLDLMGRLASLKGFFLLARGDYMNHFLDAADSELGKDVATTTESAAGRRGGRRDAKSAHAVSLHRLRGLLELSLRHSTAADDLYSDSVSCSLATSSLLAQMAAGSARLTAVTGLKGYNVFSIEYRVPWPISVFLSSTAMEQYQFLFRHLFFCRYVEKAVSGCWVAHQTCKELDMRATLALSFALRQRMLHFLQNVIYYMMVEVLEPRWHELMERIGTATNLDEVAAHHHSCLQTCMSECLLTSHDLLKLLTKLITLCLLFSNQITTSIEDHRLSNEDLDKLAGVNKASERARAALERGEYYDDVEDDESDARSVMSRTSATSKRRTSRQLDSAARKARAKPTAAELRTRRKARLATQTDAMQRTMAQRGWQAMIEKSSRMFDTLLHDFLLALLDRTRADYTSHAANLCARLDYNGFYTKHLRLLGLDTSGST